MVPTIRPQLKERFLLEEAVLAYDGQAAAEASGAAGVGKEAVALDANGIVGLDLLHWHIAEVGCDWAVPVEAVSRGTGTPPARDEVHEDERAAVSSAAADRDH